MLEDRPGLIGSVSGRSRAPPQVSVFGTSPLKVRMEQIHEGSNVAGHGVVEGALQVVRFDHARRLYQAVVPDVQRKRWGPAWMVGRREDLGRESVRCWLT